jgi:hypothetical protein
MPLLQNNKSLPFLVEHGFRFDEKQTTMEIMNTSKETKNVGFERYSERTKGFTKYIDHTNASVCSLKNTIQLGSYQTVMLELK